jgi:hypothetical protein
MLPPAWIMVLVFRLQGRSSLYMWYEIMGIMRSRGASRRIMQLLSRGGHLQQCGQISMHLCISPKAKFLGSHTIGWKYVIHPLGTSTTIGRTKGALEIKNP